MKIGVPQETAQGERRVALVPDVVKALTAKGIEVVVEPGAGEGASHGDDEYTDAGAKVGDDAWGADVVLKVTPPTAEEVGRLKQGQVLIGFLEPLTNPNLAKSLADAGVTSFAMEAIPRITRAQSMDALSSQANLGGYMSVLIAARESGKLFPMMTTAAGTIPPAKVLVLGAGVAGLQAIATAKRLGGVVTGFDVRSVVKEQVQSLGGRFLEVEAVKDAEGEGGYARPLNDEENERLRKELGEAAKRQDVIITTAQIPGRPAPRLITAEAIKGMQPGSVIIDLAAETGGNVEGSKPGETVEQHGVKIIGPANLPSQMAGNASALYAKNLQNLVELLIDDEGNLKVDTEDEVIAGALLTKDGEIVNERAKEAVREGPPDAKRRRNPIHDLITEITIFVLAAFVGFEVISKVPTTLHTPLMSQTNAIHGIVMLGGLIVIGSADDTLEKVIGVIAIAFGTINIVGGFMVTDRMLGMFSGRKRKPKTESEPETVTPGESGQ